MLLEFLVVRVRLDAVEKGALVRKRSRRTGMSREAMGPEVLRPVERFGAVIALIEQEKSRISCQQAEWPSKRPGTRTIEREKREEKRRYLVLPNA
jgi:hypothetical protein